MKYKLSILGLLVNISLFGQGNCNIYPEGSGEREACLLSHKSIEFQQGSKESQMLFDEAISIGPNYAWAYYQKSVPYLKRGFLTEGLSILNKAVVLQPLDYLSYRAYWYWQYKNYELCVKDLKIYYSLPKAYIQFTPGGEKNMKNILALAYAKINNYDEAIKILEEHINEYKSIKDVDLTDYHTLGVLYYQTDQFKKSIIALNKQLSIIEMSDTYYFLGMAYSQDDNHAKAIEYLTMAIQNYNTPNKYVNSNAGFPVYLSDIKKSLEDISLPLE